MKRHMKKHVKRSCSERISKRKRSTPRDREEAVESNLPLVRTMAARLSHLPLPYDDLVAEGCIGLMKAFNKYDPSKGAAFSTYAFYRVKQSMYRASENYGWGIRIPSFTCSKISMFNRAEAESPVSEGAEIPDIDEVASRLGWKSSEAGKVRRIRDSAGINGEYSDSTVSDPDDKALPFYAMAREERKELVRYSLKQLDERKRTILSLYFGLESETPHTHKQISLITGLSRERVRQLQHEAVSTLRSGMREYRESLIW